MQMTEFAMSDNGKQRLRDLVILLFLKNVQLEDLTEEYVPSEDTKDMPFTEVIKD